jgi:hypothetical protein
MTSILQLLFYNGSFTEALLQQLSLSCFNPTLDKVGKWVALGVAPLPHHSVWAKVSGRPPPLDDSAARRSRHAHRLPASLHHN